MCTFRRDEQNMNLWWTFKVCGEFFFHIQAVHKIHSSFPHRICSEQTNQIISLTKRLDLFSFWLCIAYVKCVESSCIWMSISDLFYSNCWKMPVHPNERDNVRVSVNKCLCVQSWMNGWLAYKLENSFQRPQNTDACHTNRNTCKILFIHNNYKSMIINIFVMERKWVARYWKYLK